MVHFETNRIPVAAVEYYLMMRRHTSKCERCITGFAGEIANGAQGEGLSMAFRFGTEVRIQIAAQANPILWRAKKRNPGTVTFRRDARKY